MLEYDTGRTAGASEDEAPAPDPHIESGDSAIVVSDMLRERAQTRPDQVFLEIGTRQITYAELDERVDRLAQWLLDNVGGPGRRIGLQTTGTEALAVGALGLKRAGMVSVCLDPMAPAPWIGQALTDCDAALLLSDVAQASALIPCPVVHPFAVGATPPPGGVRTTPGPIASIVYTSGSTGEAKGVVVASALQLSPRSSQARQPQDRSSRPRRHGFLGFGSVGFMESSIHLALTYDETLVAYDLRVGGIHGLGTWLFENRISTLVAPPTLLRHVLSAMPTDLRLPDLRLVILYGEAANWRDLANLWPHVDERTMVTAHYGCSEAYSIARMVVTASTPAEQGRLPAGALVEGVAVTIEDLDHQPLPEGETGEIVAWSDHISLGYWNRPEATARVFGVSDDGRSFVRTGDLGRFRPDGILEHLGRMDDMVKVSGHRVMLSEIETALNRFSGSAAAAAAAQQDAEGNTRIVAYVVPEPTSSLDGATLRAAIAEELPAAAVPDQVHVVAELPMLSNGKVDRVALSRGFVPAPAPARMPGDEETAKEIAAVIIAIWSQVLGVDAGADDNFFELGGDSLRAARLFAEIEMRLGVDLPLSLLVEAPTPNTLAAAIAEADDIDSLIVPVRTTGSLPPLFIVHDASGSVLFARVMAQELDVERPVYAIRGEALLGVVTGAESVQALASRYLPGVLETTSGPCALYGPSAGGVIAFEMALQLADKGVEVTFLGMADSFGPGSPVQMAPGRDNRLHRRRRLNDLREAQWRRRPRMAVRFLWRRSVAVFRHNFLRRRDMNAGDDRVREAIMRSHAEGTVLPREFRSAYAIAHYGALSVLYQPGRSFDGSIALLRTAEAGSEDRGWSDYVTGEVRTFPIREFHYQLLEEETVRRTARVLNEALSHW